MTRAQTIKDFERMNRKLELKFMPLVKRAIHAKVETVISKLKSDGFNATINYLHTDISNPQMAKVIETLYLSVGLLYARMNYSSMFNENGRKGSNSEMITKGFGFSQLWHNFIVNYFKRYLLQVVTLAIAHTTRDALLRVLTDASANGWGVDKTVENLTDWPYEQYQAARIVRTEVNRAANVGAKANSDTLSYQQNKEWLSAQDFRVRGMNPKDHADHVALNGVKIDSEDHFIDPRNGDRLDFPGDITASAESVIKCRCHALYTAKRDSNGNLIPKRTSTAVIFPGDIRRPQTVLI